MVVILGLDGSVLLPKEIREELDANALFEVAQRPDGVIELRPYGTADPDQRWFWSERWQQMEREADEDYAAGRWKRFNNIEDFIADPRYRP
jgi:bifunctional DNA-binding transcriptional regulator/antitoxin component of YhaV-PrlF toxin-antitoxin module